MRIDVRGAADVRALLDRRVAVVDRGPQPAEAERREPAGLVLRERLRRIEEERPGCGLACDRVEHGEREGERLARRRSRRHDDVLAAGRRLPRLRLVRVEPGDARAASAAATSGCRSGGSGSLRPARAGSDAAVAPPPGRRAGRPRREAVSPAALPRLGAGGCASGTPALRRSQPRPRRASDLERFGDCLGVAAARLRAVDRLDRLAAPRRRSPSAARGRRSGPGTPRLTSMSSRASRRRPSCSRADRRRGTARSPCTAGTTAP